MSEALSKWGCGVQGAAVQVTSKSTTHHSSKTNRKQSNIFSRENLQIYIDINIKKIPSLLALWKVSIHRGWPIIYEQIQTSEKRGAHELCWFACNVSFLKRRTRYFNIIHGAENWCPISGAGPLTDSWLSRCCLLEITTGSVWIMRIILIF